VLRIFAVGVGNRFEKFERPGMLPTAPSEYSWGFLVIDAA
jgi:hypothetical protein